MACVCVGGGGGGRCTRAHTRVCLTSVWTVLTTIIFFTVSLKRGRSKLHFTFPCSQSLFYHLLFEVPRHHLSLWCRVHVRHTQLDAVKPGQIMGLRHLAAVKLTAQNETTVAYDRQKPIIVTVCIWLVIMLKMIYLFFKSFFVFLFSLNDSHS